MLQRCPNAKKIGQAIYGSQGGGDDGAGAGLHSDPGNRRDHSAHYSADHQLGDCPGIGSGDFYRPHDGVKGDEKTAFGRIRRAAAGCPVGHRLLSALRS